MAVTLSSRSIEHSFSISKWISRFRPKSSTRSNKTAQKSQQNTILDERPPLIPARLPLVLPEHQTTLPALGWTTISFPEPSPSTPTPSHPSPEEPYTPPPSTPHPLQSAYEALFAASQAFFAQPTAHKAQWAHKLGTEEGWSHIPGEKEFITLRTLAYCPDMLQAPAQRYWHLMGAHLSNTLGRVSTSLGLPGGEDAGLRRFVGPCARMPDCEAMKTATMLRLFRYEGWDAKVVAEPHADLGLLSVVVGNVPGLEVWDGYGWFDVERAVEAAGKKGASMLVGRQLERMSCGRYGAGGHRVVSYGPPEKSDGHAQSGNGALSSTDEKRYRFSIVFVLRAHEPLLIDSDELETDITGKWAQPLKNVSVGDFYEQIKGAHYNINIGHEEREKQRKNVARALGKEEQGRPAAG